MNQKKQIVSDIARFQEHLITEGHSVGGSGADNIYGKNTSKAALNYIKRLCKEKGYAFYSNNPYWFRMSDDFTDKFTDYLVIVKGGKVVSISNATTKAGKYWVYNPVTVGGITGTGVRVAGQTKNSHRYERRKNKWKGRGFFKQISPLKIYRDGNKDLKVDKEIITKAPSWFGFFLHAMGSGRRIWNWSAGCLGTPLNQWVKNVDPYFFNGQIVSDTIFEV